MCKPTTRSGLFSWKSLSLSAGNNIRYRLIITECASRTQTSLICMCYDRRCLHRLVRGRPVRCQLKRCRSSVAVRKINKKKRVHSSLPFSRLFCYYNLFEYSPSSISSGCEYASVFRCPTQICSPLVLQFVGWYKPPPRSQPNTKIKHPYMSISF